MKKIFTISIILIIFSTCFVKVCAKENNDFDGAINEVISGIDEENFKEITEYLNGVFNQNLSFKDILISFLTGDSGPSFNQIIKAFTGLFSDVIDGVKDVLRYVLFIGIFCTLLNIINSKNDGNNSKNVIYFICYSLVLMLCVRLIDVVFSTSFSSIEKMANTVDGSFPTLLTLSEFSGGFGSGIFKPMSYIVSLLSSTIIKNVFFPVLQATATCVVVGNLSLAVKLDSLKKSLLSLIKWSLGIITILFTVFLTAQSFVNMQYNGISFKILKYATGSIIPIVGGFISGSMDVLLSSAILVKNSFGLMLVFYVFLTVGSAGFTVLIISFILKFAVSVCEPILDERFVKLLNGIGEVFSSLTAVIFVCGFSYILVCFSLINSTALIL